MTTSSPSSRKNPFFGYLNVNRRLTGKSLGKETRHFEITPEGESVQYEAGDAIGILPTNDPELVKKVLRILQFSGEEPVKTRNGTAISLRDALLRDYALTEPSKPLLLAIAKKNPSAAAVLKDVFDPSARMKLAQYLAGKDILDHLEEFRPIRFTPEELTKLLSILQPRLYSIASSQKVYPHSIHLTVTIVRYLTAGRLHCGVCSNFLAERATVIPMFVHTAKHFHMPKDPDIAMIMVGPGTGIAPFRAFLQERKAIGARGRNWLFFGGRRRVFDFFYRNELEAFYAEGTLHHLDTAFSRDQECKVYVQHRMLEKAKEIYHWLESGAYLYICGDATHMAKEVDDSLRIIIEKSGGKTIEQAGAYIKELKKAKRYRRDIY